MTSASEALTENNFLPRFRSACDHYAGKERFIEKAFALQAEMKGAFDITLDLEDGAPADASAEHLEMFLEILERPRAEGQRIGIRVHPFEDQRFEDEVTRLAKSDSSLISHITVPKIEGSKQAARVASRFAMVFSGRHCPALHFLIETPRAIEEVFEIAALPEVEVLDFGLMDFVSFFSGVIPETAMRSPGQFEHSVINRAKTRIASAAAMHGKIAAHNVCVDYQSPKTCASDAERACRQLGFGRMWSIHPSQIEIILKAFSPAEDLLERAAELLDRAKDAAWGPIEFEGRLHDRASYRHFWYALLRAKASGMALPSGAEELIS